MRVYAFDCVVERQHHRAFMAQIDGPLMHQNVEIEGVQAPIEPSQWLFDRVLTLRASDGLFVQKIARQVRRRGFSITGMRSPPTEFHVIDIELDGGVVRTFTADGDLTSFKAALKRMQLQKSGSGYHIRREVNHGLVEIVTQQQAQELGIESLTRLVRTGIAVGEIEEYDPITTLENEMIRKVQAEMAAYGVKVSELKIAEVRRSDTGESIMEDLRRSKPSYAPIFLSHTSSDKPFARRLRNDLIKNGVDKVWFDEAEIKLGDSLVEKIQLALESTRYFAIVLSPRALSSKWVVRELEFALVREISDSRPSILPLIYEPCELPPFLKGKLYADFSRPENYDAGIAQILDRLSLPVWTLKKI